MEIGNYLSDGFISVMMLAARFVFAYLVVIWLAVVYWAFRDIRRRSNQLVVQLGATLMVAVGLLPGYWLYLVLRPRTTIAERTEEAFRRSLFADYRATSTCPSCSERLRDDFILCPSCEKPVREPCNGCSRALLAAWKSCPYCGLTAPGRKFGQSPTPVPEELPDMVTSTPVHA